MVGEVVELGEDGELGGRPQRLVDVGVDPADDLGRRRRAGRDGRAHLLEPLLAVGQIVAGQRGGVGRTGPWPGSRVTGPRSTIRRSEVRYAARVPSGCATTVLPRPRTVSPVSTARWSPSSTTKHTESAV